LSLIGLQRLYHVTVRMSISVMNFFCKTHKVFQFDEPAVIQDSPSAHPSEHLMLVRGYRTRRHGRRPVKDRRELHLKPAVTGSEKPLFHIVIFRDMECHIIQLVSLPVIEEDIFRRRRCIPEPVPDIESERSSADRPVSGTPVPGIVVSPDAPAPVQRPIILLRTEPVGHSVK